jgi:hypothetical protein
MPLYYEKERFGMKKITGTFLLALCLIRDWTISASFWKMAFVAILLRLFVMPPLGAILALVMGVAWCLGNAGGIRDFVCSVRRRNTT